MHEGQFYDLTTVILLNTFRDVENIWTLWLIHTLINEQSAV